MLCAHNWRYWEMILRHKTDKYINGTRFIRWRKCKKCQKQQKYDRRISQFRWKKSTRDLPENLSSIDVEVRLSHEIYIEPKDVKRDRLINNILNCK